MAKEVTHGPPRRVDRCLARAVRREPGAVRAGDLAAEIGDGSDHRRALLSWRPVVRTIVAARLVPQRPGVVDPRDAAIERSFGRKRGMER